MKDTFQSNKKLQYFIFALSTEFFMFIIAKAYFVSLSVHFAIGLTIVYFLYTIDILKKYKIISLKYKLLGLVLGCILCFFLSGYCFETWRYSTKISSLLQSVTTDPLIFLRKICYFLAILPLPFVSITINYLINTIKYFIRSISVKRIFHSVIQKLRFKCVVLYFGEIVVSSILGTFLLLGAYSIPIDNIIENVRKSAIIWRNESKIVFSWCSSQLDDWTDALMLLEASQISEKPIINQALMAYRGEIINKNPNEVLPSHFIDEEDFTGTTDYPRYWHGNQLYIKLLFLIMDYHQFRIFNGCVQFGLFFISSFLLYKRRLARYIIPWTIGYLMLMPVVLAKSLQYSPCYYILMTGSILLLCIDKKHLKKVFTFCFLSFGILTSYFDLLTLPPLTYSIPMLVYLLRQSSDSCERKMSDLLSGGICWCLGYIGMWSMKWFIGTILTDHNIFVDAANAIQMRTSMQSYDGLHNSPLDSVLMNITTFLQTPFSFLLIVLFGYTIFKINQSGNFQINDINQIPMLIVGSVPIFWYILTVNHSTIHYWFTNKDCLSMVIASGFACIDQIDKMER